MKKIVYGITVDTKDAEGSIDKLNKKLEELNQNAEGNADAIKEVTDALEELGKTGKDSGDKAGKGIKGIGTSIGGLLKSLGIITLIVKAFETLKEALQRNQKAADFLAKAGVALEIVMDTLVQKAIVPLAEWLVKAFTEPKVFIDDLKKSVETVKTEFEKFGNYIGSQFIEGWLKLEKSILNTRIQWNKFTGDSDEADELIEKVQEIDTELNNINQSQEEYEQRAVDAFNAAKNAIIEFTKETLAAADAQVELDNAARIAEANRAQAQLEFQRRAEELRQIRDDEFRSIEERIEASQQLATLLTEQEQLELSYAQAALNRAKVEEARNKGNIDLVLAIKEAQTNLADVRERLAGQRSEQLNAERGLLREIVALEEERRKKLLEVEAEIQKLLSFQSKQLNEFYKIVSDSIEIDLNIQKNSIDELKTRYQDFYTFKKILIETDFAAAKENYDNQRLIADEFFKQQQELATDIKSLAAKAAKEADVTKFTALEKEIKFKLDLLKLYNERYEEQEEIANNASDRLLALSEQKGLKLRLVEQERKEILIQIEKDYWKERADITREQAALIANIFAGENGLSAALNTSFTNVFDGVISMLETFKNSNSTLLDDTMATLGTIGAAIQAIGDISDAVTEQRLANINAELETSLNALNAQREAGILSEQEYQDAVFKERVAAYNKEETLRKKSFEQNKALGIVNAVISTAQAVISAFNAGASLGAAGVVMGPVMAAIAAAAGIAQIAVISSQKYTPGAAPTAPTGISAGVPSTPSVPSAGNQQQPNVTFVGTGSNVNTAGFGKFDNINAKVSITEIESVGHTVNVYETSSTMGGG